MKDIRKPWIVGRNTIRIFVPRNWQLLVHFLAKFPSQHLRIPGPALNPTWFTVPQSSSYFRTYVPLFSVQRGCHVRSKILIVFLSDFDKIWEQATLVSSIDLPCGGNFMRSKSRIGGYTLIALGIIFLLSNLSWLPPFRSLMVHW